MYLEIDENLKKIIKERTFTNYDFKGNLANAETVNIIIRDLLEQIDVLEEQIENLKNNDASYEDEIDAMNIALEEDRKLGIR